MRAGVALSALLHPPPIFSNMGVPGIEPGAFPLSEGCSTTELHTRKKMGGQAELVARKYENYSTIIRARNQSGLLRKSSFCATVCRIPNR